MTTMKKRKMTMTRTTKMMEVTLHKAIHDSLDVIPPIKQLTWKTDNCYQPVSDVAIWYVFVHGEDEKV